jgi:hypothetical protein
MFPGSSRLPGTPVKCKLCHRAMRATHGWGTGRPGGLGGWGDGAPGQRGDWVVGGGDRAGLARNERASGSAAGGPEESRIEKKSPAGHEAGGAQDDEELPNQNWKRTPMVAVRPAWYASGML